MSLVFKPQKSNSTGTTDIRLYFCTYRCRDPVRGSHRQSRTSTCFTRHPVPQ